MDLGSRSCEAPLVVDKPMRDGRQGGRTYRGHGWQVKFACGLGSLLPGAMALAVEALAAGDGSKVQQVDIGRRYEPQGYIRIHARCNDSGCGGSGEASERIKAPAGLLLTLELTHTGAPPHKQTITLTTPNFFVPPLSGALKLADVKLSPDLEQQLRNAYRKCKNLAFERLEWGELDLVPEKGEL